MRQPTYLITEVDESILRALARFHYLTAAQASRLLYPTLLDDNRYMQRRLKRLVDTDYLLRLRALPMPQYGQAPHVFTLAHKGRVYTQEMGIGLPTYFRPSEEKRATWNHPFMTHRLATIDVMIAADRLCREEGIVCPRMLSERELKQEAVHVQVPPGPNSLTKETRKVTVIPDAWFQLGLSESEPYSIAIELDRGTEEQKVWRQKVAAYAYWVNGPYQEAFETDNLTIATVCLTDTRTQQLADWTLKELRGRNLEELADLFLFTAASPVTTAPADLFFAPLWRSVSNEPLSLLDTPAQRHQESGVLFRSA
jgi:protein involved in plasmid replication-relaxation